MRFTLFPDRFGTSAYPQDATLEELAASIPVTVRKQKDDLPLLKFAMFGNKPNEKNCLRYDDNVIEITGLEADYDGGKISFKKAIEIAEQAGLLALLYSSPSYTAKTPRWRVLCPFCAHHAPRERDHFMGRLSGAYGGVFAPESWTLSQSYFFGRLMGGPPPLVQITGRTAIDLLDGLDGAAIAKPNGAGRTFEIDRPAYDEAALLQSIISGKTYHRAALSLLGRWAWDGVPMLEAQGRLTAAFESVFPLDRDERWPDRFGEIPKLLGYVYGKHADKEDARVSFTLRSTGAAAREPEQPGAARDDATPASDGTPEDLGDENARRRLPMTNWFSREVAPSERVLGHLITTTSRMMLVGPTGLGKSNFSLAEATALAGGQGFLHWAGTGIPRRVLYIDGEMSVRMMRDRLVDCVRRNNGVVPGTMYVLSREDFPDMRPLNTPAGQQFVDRIIKLIGGVDVIFFDNVQALLAGDMKEEVPWRQTLPWVWDLTRREIAQVWIHHTGHDESHSYGTKTREWQLDTVALMEAVERPEADIAFALRFTKARERGAHNRADFDPVIVTLADDRWAFERGGIARSKRTATDRAFELLRDALAREGVIPVASSHIPTNTPCVTEGMWRAYCEKGTLTDSSPDAFRKAFKRATEKLIGSRVGKWDLWVWIIK